MNAMKFSGKAIALCFAAGIAAAALSACGDKKTEEPAEQPNAQTQPAQTAQAAQMQDFDMKPATEAEILEIFAFLPDPLATVDGEAIPRKELIDLYVEKELPAEIYRRYGEDVLREEMPHEIENLVKTHIMLKLAEKAGIKPSAEFVAQEIKDEFEGLSEEDREYFEEMLKDSGSSLDEFIKEKSQDADTQKLAALRKYTHSVFLEKAKKEVSDADVRKEYDDHIKELTRPENVTVAHILVQLDENADEAADKAAKAKIDAIYDELLKDPSQFGKIAAEKSDCPSKADEGKLPAFEKDGEILEGGRMDQTFTDAAFAIEKVGQITKPVKTQFGYHIIKLLEKAPEEVVPFEKLKDRITEFLAAEKAQAELDKTLEDAVRKSVKFNDFAPAKEKDSATK